MARLLIQRKSKSTVKQPKKESGVEFRWSTSINRYGSPVNELLLNFQHLDLDNSQEKTFRPSASSPTHHSSDNTPQSSPRLSNFNEINQRKKCLISIDENPNGKFNPLSLTYSQLYQTQPKKNSLVPLRNNSSIVNPNALSNSAMINREYIRLQTSELRRLHVSKKYIKEAKNLYFNAASKVFVPRHSIVQIS